MVTISEAEWQAVQQELATLRAQVQTLTRVVAVAQQRIKELEAQKTPPPAFVKTNKPVRTTTTVRKKRAPDQNHARRYEVPTHVVTHPITQCATCQGQLSALHVGRRCHVIEVPPPPPMEVIEHQLQRGWCSYCHAWREAPLDLHDQVVGQGRIGTRLATTIVTMRTILRLPIRLIQQWLTMQQQVHLSVGAITGLLQRLATHVQPVADQILAQIRGSPVVFADETGWREAGKNGYIWSMGTPEGAWYYERHASRAGAIINTLLGETFTGVLITDFYAGYNDTPGGQHQRCWVHLLRDLHALKVDQPQHAAVHTWAKAVREVFDQTRAACAGDATVRLAARTAGEATLWTLGTQYAQEKGHPCQTLAKRLLRHHGELLVFVTTPGVTPDNHTAERGVRPLVVARKIRGGTRSTPGSTAHMILTSIVQTCRAQTRDVFSTLLRLFQSPFPQL